MSEAFACLVGIGLLVEYGDEIIDCFAKQHLPSIPLFGGLLVTAGVFGEVFFSRLALITTEELQERADSDVAQANKQAAEAFDRAARAEQAAAEANLESDRLRQELADRMVSADGRGAMVAELAKFAGQSIMIRAFPLTREIALLAHQIADVLRHAKWEVETLLSDEYSGSPSVFGAGHVIWSTEDEQSIEAATALFNVLRSHIGGHSIGLYGNIKADPPRPLVALTILEKPKPSFSDLISTGGLMFVRPKPETPNTT